MQLFNFNTAVCALISLLSTSGLANAARPWGLFGSTNAFNVNRPCNDPTSFLFTSTPVIWGSVYVTHGTLTSSIRGVIFRYEVVYAYNTSSLDVPVDLGVITTNDNFTGLYIPFQYREFNRVRVGTEVEVVTYEGVGINTLAACRVRAST